jgi:predicted amidohydrolase YtcJ
MLVSVLCALVTLIAVQTPAPSNSGPQASSAGQPMLISGGTIITNDDQNPRAEAVLVIDGRIAAVGTLAEVREQLPAAQVRHWDLNGAFLYPGFADGHAHLVGIGAAMNRADLVGTRSFREVLDRVREFADGPFAEQLSRGNAGPTRPWIRGRGWDQNDWKVKEFPSHDALSAAFPKTPVMLTRVDGHAALANAAAMKAAGITAQSKSPSGGRIVLDADGNPTGVFIDTAIDLLTEHAPQMSQAELEQAVRLAAKALHQQGISSIHDAGASLRQIQMYQKLAGAGELNLRVHVMASADRPKELEHWFERGPLLDPEDQVQVRAIKIYSDGALGSRGAAMLEDYSDDPGNRGLMISEMDQLMDVAYRGLLGGFQVCSHAIGDRGNRTTLDAYLKAHGVVALMNNPERGVNPGSKARFRIEHAQVISLDDIPRFEQLGVLPAMQTQHQVSDMPWAEDRIGPERIKGAYAWQSLIESGSIVINGSDAPVERLDSVGSFLAAVTRADADGMPKGGWYSEQAMSRQDALKSLTSWPAYGAFWEDELGSVTTGKRADFTVLGADLLNDPIAELRQAKVLATVFGGEIVYQAEL